MEDTELVNELLKGTEQNKIAWKKEVDTRAAPYYKAVIGNVAVEIYSGGIALDGKFASPDKTVYFAVTDWYMETQKKNMALKKTTVISALKGSKVW